jgi:hypothetical protein
VLFSPPADDAGVGGAQGNSLSNAEHANDTGWLALLHACPIVIQQNLVIATHGWIYSSKERAPQTQTRKAELV